MKQILLFILSIMAVKAFAQKDDLIFKLAKKDIIDKAEAVFQASYPDFKASNFDRINLSKSNKNRYQLSFSNSIVYIPQGKAYYSLGKCFFILVQKEGLSQPDFRGLSSTVETSDNVLHATQFYQPLAAYKKAMQSVLKILEKDQHHHPEGIISHDQRLVIMEMKDTYKVYFKEESSDFFSVEIIYKSDGKVTDEMHGEPIPPQFKEEKWEKLKW